jgi:very-short-patch-repair endonuclease
VKLLERHRAKRAQRLPVISCFLGPADEARRVLGSAVEIEDDDVPTAYAARLCSRPLWRDALVLAAARASRDAEVLEAELHAKSDLDLSLFFRSLDLPEGARELIEARLRSADPPALELRALAHILPEGDWPALFLPSPSDRALVSLARLVEEHPSVSAAVVIDEAQLERAPPRVAAMLREGLIRPWEDARELARAQVTAAREPAQAKSAAEQFLFEVLQAMPDTRGLFALNARMSFDFGRAPAEIDLASAARCIAIEVDGWFHFQDADAYRRDRRKDLLLQSHGWLVLRFLAEDVVVRLEETIATIRHALALRAAGGLEA